jgi:dipeptidyl aminopeptidase/acylaminoacyl peptidase
VFDVYLRGLGDLIKGGQVSPVWTPDGRALGFVDGPPAERAAWRVDLETGERRELVDAGRARTAVAAVTDEPVAGTGVPFAAFSFAGDDAIRFDVGRTTITLDLATYQATKQPAAALADELYGLSERARTAPREYLRSNRLVDAMKALETPSPDGTWLLSTADCNLVVRSTVDGRARPLTTDGTRECEWRFDAPTALDSAWARSGTGATWSPDSRKVAAFMVDLRGLYEAPQVHYLKPQDEVVFKHRAQAGGVLERTTLYVLDVRGKPPVQLQLGDTTDTYPVTVAWLPDSSAVIVFRLTRDCRRADVLIANPEDGTVRPLFSEQGRSFVRIHHDVYAQAGVPKVGLWLTPDGRLVWQSDRTGWRHYYLYDLEGTLVRQLTGGEWPVEDVVAVRDGLLYFTGHGDQHRPYDLQLYRVPLDGGDVQALTDAPGVHAVAFAPSGTAFLDRHSLPDRPPVVELRSTDGRPLGELARTDISRLEDLGYVPPEQFTVGDADGETELWGLLFRPHDFDPSRRYPVLEYIYGGPQSVTVQHSFVEGSPIAFGSAVAQALAQLGYVTVVLDARGTPGRSKAFHDASYLRWANVLADDHAEAIRQLAARYDFIDGARVGITGHSWGGYSAFRCLADRPDVYRAAVCSAPGFDPYSSLLYECYLDLPAANPEGYAFAATYPLAERLEGALLIAVGTSDRGCWTDAVKMSEALIRAGKAHEFVVLPGQYHAFDSVHEAYFWHKLTDFFARHLQA